MLAHSQSWGGYKEKSSWVSVIHEVSQVIQIIQSNRIGTTGNKLFATICNHFGVFANTQVWLGANS